MNKPIFLIDLTEQLKWEYTTITPPAMVGRNSSCDLVILDDASISGEHAQLVWQDDNLMCSDLGSTNGTRLNGNRITQEAVHDGDLLMFGQHSYLVKIADSLPRLYLPEENKVIALGMSPFFIGRSTANHLTPGDKSISTRHASINFENGRYFIKDYKSTNGTRVNGERISLATLRDRDTLQLSKWAATFLLENMTKDDYSLRFLSGEREGEVVEVKSKMTIGRSEDNDIVIPHNAISQHHAEIGWAHGTYWLEDLGSSNGTRVGGMRVKKVPLKGGAEISIAHISFLFFSKQMPAEKFFLVFSGGPQGGEEIELDQPTMTIGRAGTVSIQILGNAVSLQHAKVTSQGSSFAIQDLQSKNGTFVNGGKITTAVLKHGDQLQIGVQSLVFRSSLRARPKIIQEESYVLVPCYAKGYGQPIPIDKELAMGRDPKNQIVLNAKFIEPRHAFISQEQGSYYICDSQSNIGTLVNDERIVARQLKHGDEIRIGRFTFVFKNSLRPLPKKTDMTATYWLCGLSAAVMLIIFLSMVFLSPFSNKNHETDQPQQVATKGPQIKDDDLFKEYRQRLAKISGRYQYKEIPNLTAEYSKKLSLLANRQSVEEESKKLAQEAKFFAEFVQRLAASNMPMQFSFQDKGTCVVEKVREESLSLRRADSLVAVFEALWEDVALETIFALLDETALPKDKPAEAVAFAIAHNYLPAAEKYFALLWDSKTEQRDKTQEWYAQVFKFPLPEGGLVLDNGKLIPLAQKQAQDKAQADRLEAEHQAQALLERKQAEEIARQREREEFSMRYNIINDFFRTYGYRKAITQFEAFEKDLYAQDLQQKVRQRLDEIEPYAQLFDKLLATINSGGLKSDEIQFSESVKGKLVAADLEQFQVTIPQGATKFKWYNLPPQKLYTFYSQIELSADEMFLVGRFCFDNGMFVEGNHTLVALLERAPQEKNKIEAYISEKTGIPIPKEGFVPHQGMLVSRDEKEKRLKGLIKYNGKWVTPDEKEKLAAGFVKYQGKWVAPDEKKMLSQGYTKYQEKWYTKEELAAMRTNWENAWTHETAHYKLRSNIGDEFIQELGRFMEAAFVEYEKFFGGKAVKNKMNIYALRTYDDYRNYCLSTNNSGQLRAGGFAVSIGNIGVGWMRDGPKQILFTMIHEGAHLYHYNSYPGQAVPSWFAEGVATQFEGYEWDGKALKMTFISLDRLRWLQRVLLRKQEMPFAQLMDGNALELINQDAEKAADFYAQCWGVYYYMANAAGQEEQDKFKGFVIEVNTGKARGKEKGAFMEEFEKGLPALEAAWRKHILGMK